MSFLVFDVESVAIDNAVEYLEPATAPSNYKDPTAIENFIARANTEALAKAALDVDLARIVCIGVSDGSKTTCAVCKTEEDEAAALAAFWKRAAPMAHSTVDRPTLIGFNCLGFDLPLLLRRSLYLGTPWPKLQIGKYRHDGIRDLMMELSFDGALRYRGLKFYAKRLGLEMPPDPYTGADIASLIADNNWDAVADHCRADVNLTVALAKRMGVL